ncbi:MAG: FmdE, Molybdenum formylmethanofuran dehydrogenase operon [Euryarchaeota archaeon ADurb.Bin190]|jgi:formylmethanofuran dehydrogenase subunit E|nr:MAG: FmdE, Molybdenum formylmethanofuran dehydrogenase operon [Euryarchaeota archaeon ADurb.Bin190]HNQ54788.1 FmdE family protein [Methanothrix sp.]HPA98517.1 FmdE family protein [Methanothrix sp.]
MEEDFKKAAEFHGHVCPGLAMGYRVARYVKAHYPRSEDEELVCIAENKSCSVDAVQFLLGCTAGKGNLIVIDNGKQAFTFYSRNQGKALRIYFKGDVFAGMDGLRQKMAAGNLTPAEKKEMEGMRSRIMEQILASRDEDLLDVREAEIPAPDKARIYPSLVCQECGERFMEIMGRTAEGKVLCKGCFEKKVC